MSPYIFIPLSMLIFLGMNLYNYKSLKNNLILSKFKWTLRVVFILIFLFEAAYFIAIKSSPLPPMIYQISIICIGVSFMLFCTIIPFQIALFFINKLKRNNKKIAKFIVDICIILGFILYIIVGAYNANFNTIITNYDIKIKNLKTPLNLAIITDVHIGEFFQKEYMASLVDRINLLKPDALLIVGNLVDLSSDEIGDFLDPLKDVNSKFGTFMVVGNHEYYHGIDGLINKFKELGIRVLENQSLEIAGVNLAGVYDITGFKMGKFEPDFIKALKYTNPNLPTILLTHQPRSLQYLHKDVDLAILGHTHGGQIFPFSFLVWLNQKYIYGLYKINENMQIVVSSGAGLWGPPFRVGTNSEIVYLKLKGE
ncbi:metallophosphoesterase [Campylobacter vicugnae]|uniref:metallophosphoesterase n=1 Tax=Campylobacter vicugnae TaxID=1660076 RepID=UPI00255074A2|nr:metallophosphoesterase [Campylobacter ovis]MDL0104802.1 metallophosphoesterase [Campylobacter ovis]MDL0106020.1 metallophosphoesterase [Campylobacter ovis]